MENKEVIDSKDLGPTLSALYELDVVKQKLTEKDKEIEILKKALELACETIREMLGDKPYYICGNAIAERLGIPMVSEIKDYNYFIEQAKEQIEGESK